MNTVLQHLLNRLEGISVNHQEIFDSEVRQNMSNVIMDGFVRQTVDYTIPVNFGMFSEQANDAVREAIAEFISTANKVAHQSGMNAFYDRLDFMQDDKVRTNAGNDYEEFLGHSPSTAFDENGNVIRNP